MTLTIVLERQETNHPPATKLTTRTPGNFRRVGKGTPNVRVGGNLVSPSLPSLLSLERHQRMAMPEANPRTPIRKLTINHGSVSDICVRLIVIPLGLSRPLYMNFQWLDLAVSAPVKLKSTSNLLCHSVSSLQSRANNCTDVRRDVRLDMRR